jgi:phosphoribosylanthranilate isomerase
VTLWIKVCGMRTAEAIHAAADAGADAVGFVFHAASPRGLELDLARELGAAVPGGVMKVAVFRHPSQALLEAALHALRPDCVQTDVEDFDRLQVPRSCVRLPVYRSGRLVRTAATLIDGRYLYESAHSGAGERADWTEAARLATHGELVLAGGLDPRNVTEAIHTVRPFGVDVSSGVERARGEKDPALIQEFVTAARAASVGLASSAKGVRVP